MARNTDITHNITTPAAANASLMDQTWFHAAMWGIGLAVLTYTFVAAARARGVSPASVIGGMTAAARKVAIIVGGLLGILLGLQLLRSPMFGQAAGNVAYWLQAAVMCVVASVAGLFIARQFLAPPWWRLNAWSDDSTPRPYSGTVAEILAWILTDAYRTLEELTLRDRLIVVVGVPALMLDAADLFGTSSMLTGTYTLLLVLYVALVVALITANRIPRVLMMRLTELRYVARRIATGDLSVRANAADMGDYESFGELVADINSMARALQGRDSENQVLQHRLHALLQQEQERATRDGLTQLRNRRYFNDALSAEIVRSTRTNGRLSVGVLDLDNFKQVNDKFGHQEGDAVLQRMAYVLVGTLRPYDLACRLGGEEFGVIFPETGAEEAKVILDRIMEQLGTAGPQGASQTFSGGIASFPEHAQDMDTLVRLADEAAYEAKLKGKAKTLVYDPATTQSMDSPERRQEKERADLVATTRHLVQAVDAKESFSRDHSERTGKYAAAIARALGCDEPLCNQVYLCGLLHDVGKIGLDDGVTMKAGRLTDEEMVQMRRHPEIGAQIVANAGLTDMADWVRHHHERWDGMGYPDGLVGEAIPLVARIVRVAESFEAMTSDRVYRSASTTEQALLEFQHGVGTEYDPMVIEALTWLVETGQLVVVPSEISQDLPRPWQVAEGGAPAHAAGGQPLFEHPQVHTHTELPAAGLAPPPQFDGIQPAAMGEGPAPGQWQGHGGANGYQGPHAPAPERGLDATPPDSWAA